VLNNYFILINLESGKAVKTAVPLLCIFIDQNFNNIYGGNDWRKGK
jgi:hypothetical protein